MGFKSVEVKRYGVDGELKFTEKLTLRVTRDLPLDKAFASHLVQANEIPKGEAASVEAGGKYERKGFLFRGGEK